MPRRNVRFWPLVGQRWRSRTLRGTELRVSVLRRVRPPAKGDPTSTETAMTTQHTLTIETRGRGLTDISAQLRAHVPAAHTGLVNIFIHHTSASLIINENADPDVQRDLEAFFARLVPDGDRLFVHTAEGPDDMPAHVRAVLTATSLNVPVQNGQPMLGTWQGVYLYEHRHRPHRRRITMTFV